MGKLKSLGIRAKIILLFFVTSAFTLLVTFFISSYFILEFRQKEATQDIQKSFDLISNKINAISDEDRNILEQISKRDDIKALLHLVNNYQDKQEYKANLFNAQKQKIAMFFSSIIETAPIDIVAIYDKNGGLISFAGRGFYSKDLSVGFVEYDQGVEKAVYTRGQKLSFEGFMFPNLDAKELPQNAKSSLLDIDGTLIISTIEPIEGEGYIKSVVYIENEIIKDVEDAFGVKIGYKIDDKLFLDTLSISHRELTSINCSNDKETYTNEELFIQCKNIYTTDNKPVSLYIGYSQKEFLENRNNIRIALLIALFLGVITSAPIAFFYMNKIIINPIETLLEQLQKIRKKEYDTVYKINSKDELGELNVGILSMKQAIMKRERELETLNKSLEERVEKTINEIRDKDSIIMEQNKRRAMNELLMELAHQWRQPLNACAVQIQNIQDLIDDAENKNEIDSLVEGAVRELKSLSATITKMTNFYESKAEERITLKEGLLFSIDLTSGSLNGSGITINKNIEENLAITAKADEWVDLFSALFINVKEIVKDRALDRATITIEAKKEGDEVILSIEDDVGGIDDVLLPTKLFEPYATTRFKSRDKGLGLYTVYNIVSYRLKGSIKAQNTEKGAIFTITLPLL